MTAFETILPNESFVKQLESALRFGTLIFTHPSPSTSKNLWSNLKHDEIQNREDPSQALRWAEYDYDTAQDALKRATDDSKRAEEALDRADREYKEIMRGIPAPRAIE